MYKHTITMSSIPIIIIKDSTLKLLDSYLKEKDSFIVYNNQIFLKMFFRKYKMQKIEFGYVYRAAGYDYNGTGYLHPFELSKTVDDYIDIVVSTTEENELENGTIDRFLKNSALSTYRKFLEYDLENHDEDYHPDEDGDSYISFLRYFEIYKSVEKSFNSNLKYIGFYIDKSNQIIYDFNNLPISLKDVNSSIKEKDFDFEFYLYFEKV